MSAVISTSTPAVDLAAVKNKQHLAWSAGDYAVVGTTLQIVGESLCEALDLRAGERVLDVAAGNGNATLAAARRWCDVVSTDYVPALLERGRARASAEGLPVQFEQADAENLPYTDHSFDVVMSTFGVMFTPDQDKAAAEMARACKPGGRIGLANWTPASFVGEIFKTIGQIRAPGGRREVTRALGHRSAVARTVRRTARLDRRSSAGTSCSATTARPIGWKSFAPSTARCTRRSGHSTPTKQEALAADLIALAERFNRATDGTLVAPSEYLEVVIKCK